MKRRTLLATAAVALASVALASAAQALPSQASDPEPDPGFEVYTISGSLDLGCVVPASSVKVRVQPITSGTALWRTVTATHNGRTLVYSVSGLNRDVNYRVVPVLEPPPSGCAYGRWSPTERQVGPPPAGTNARTDVNFSFQIPLASTRIDGADAATAVAWALADPYVHLNNHGTDDSYLRVAGERHEFDVPVKVKRLCRIRGHVCVGEARFYVHDVNLLNTAVRWASGIQFDLSFESDGIEIIGEGSNGLVGPLVPDAHLKDLAGDERVSARLAFRLVLAANGTGGLTYRLLGAPAFSSRLELANGCADVLGVNVCPDIDDAAARLKAKVETKVKTHLESPEAHEKIDPKLQAALATAGVTHPVDAVVTNDTGFVLLDF